MAYTLQALIARDEVLKVIAEQNALIVIVPLKQNLHMIPIGTALQKSLDDGKLTIQFHEEHPFHRLYGAIKTSVLNASLVGRIAYVEAEFFGGMGYQSAVLWEAGKAILGPFLAQNLPLREMPINRVLREMGVQTIDEMDEFDTLGLGLYRYTDQWLPTTI